VTRLPGVAWPSIAYLGSRGCPTADRAGLVLPTTHAVEMDGTYVNRDGRVQRTRRALNPLGDSRPAYAILDQLGGTLGARLGTSTATAAFEQLAKAVPRMAGMTYKTLGKGGQALAAEPAAAVAEQPVAP
jgi:predicted molibdopterin-dependent oxidoreductase YjgC